jgi:hypothetical protein
VVQIVEQVIAARSLLRIQNTTLEIAEQDLHLLGKVKILNESVDISELILHITGIIIPTPPFVTADVILDFKFRDALVDDSGFRDVTVRNRIRDLIIEGAVPMANVDFYIKEGDLDPPLKVTCVDEDGEVIPLTAAIAVKFFLINPGDDAPKIDGAVADILTPVADGKVEYVWASGDTDTPGDYDAEFEIEWSSGKKTTFPNFRFLRVKIAKSIDTTD